MGFHHNEQRVPQIGEVYLMDFGGSGCEQNGWRPGVVFQNNVGNAHSPNIIALPLTSSIKKAGQPTHVVIKSADSIVQPLYAADSSSKSPRYLRYFISGY